MQVSNVLQGNAMRPNRAPQQPPTPPGDEPPQPPQGDGWSQAGTAGAAVLAGAGFGFLGFHAGVRGGAMLGLLLTQPGSGLGDPGLLGNVLTGVRVGAIAGTLVGAAAGVSLVYLAREAMKENQ